ncbi:hypothetical protein C489_13453 [Natrinema versiforme JCM 10478]|uniref:Uncharacterized protein n=1 Tax=Natrinema versiforme JCM 10478 TaxID=1227496 RepID=L9XWM3_9EURY|nr:hypothetical protein C489_13453 [Natrinema versiforme JCM 10478]
MSAHNLSTHFYDALNEEVAELLDAAECAEANNWKTAKSCDL